MASLQVSNCAHNSLISLLAMSSNNFYSAACPASPKSTTIVLSRDCVHQSVMAWTVSVTSTVKDVQVAYCITCFALMYTLMDIMFFHRVRSLSNRYVVQCVCDAINIFRCNCLPLVSCYSHFCVYNLINNVTRRLLIGKATNAPTTMSADFTATKR